MTSFFSFARRATALTFGLLGAGWLAGGLASAQVGAQVAPVLAHPLFRDAAKGPLNSFVLPGGVSVLLTQKGGFLVSATVQTKYDAPSGLTVTGGTGAAQGSTSQGTSVAARDAGLSRAAAAIGVLSGFGDGMAQPLEAFLNRADVGPRLGQGFTINAEPFTIGAKVESGVLKLTLTRAQVPEAAFAPTRNALAARNASARPVVVRVYSDFQCPFCQKFEAETLPTLLAKLPDDVRIEFHQFPLEQIHPLARASAEASECAAQQGRFWAYKDALFTDRSWLASNPQEVFTRLAGKVGLNSADFQKCLTARGGKEAVDAGLAEAMRLGLNGTPSVFVNGFRPASPYDANELLRLIDFARVATGAPAPAPAPTPKTP